VVGYDSIIPPGREGSIKPSVALKNTSGKFTKTVTVLSNATNTPDLKLTITGDAKPIISMSSTFLQIKNNDPKPYEIVLSTEKPDLKILKISVKAQSNGQENWQVQLPTYLEHELSKPSAPKPDGFRDYTLKVSAKLGEMTEGKYGDIVIETNHPEKAELTLKGRVEPK